MIALPIYKHLAGMDPADLSKVNLSITEHKPIGVIRMSKVAVRNDYEFFLSVDLSEYTGHWVAIIDGKVITE